jgi:ATP-dependent DNA helicase RecG
VETNDGFKIAEHDLKLRGAGNLSKESDRQSGADETFLFGRGVRMDILEDLVNEFEMNPKPMPANQNQCQDNNYGPRM